jgi:hypothetical protein
MNTPPTLPPIKTQASKDQEHLRLLAIFHYVVAGLMALFACFPLIHVAVGLMFYFSPDTLKSQDGSTPPEWFGLLFVVLGGTFVLLGWAMAICTFYSGRCIAKRRKRMFSFVVAALLCMFMPFGTVLGIFTIVALGKDSVRALYAESASGLS